jgi:hypothetical protein
MLFVALGEAVSCLVVGPVVLRVIKRLPSRFLA